MKKLLSILWVALIATAAWASRTFDGTEAIYLNAGAVTWWTDANAVQRAVLDNTTPVICNTANSEQEVKYPMAHQGHEVTDLLTGEKLTLGTTTTLAPYEYRIYKH